MRFFEEVEGNLAWESLGDFQHTNVHKQVAITFRTPRYKTIDVDKSVKVSDIENTLYSWIHETKLCVLYVWIRSALSS